MSTQPINTEAEYLAALKEVSVLVDVDPDPDTADGERLNILSALVQAYEARFLPMGQSEVIR